MANFKAFRRIISSSINLLFLKSAYLPSSLVNMTSLSLQVVILSSVPSDRASRMLICGTAPTCVIRWLVMTIRIRSMSIKNGSVSGRVVLVVVVVLTTLICPLVIIIIIAESKAALVGTNRVKSEKYVKICVKKQHSIRNFREVNYDHVNSTCYILGQKILIILGQKIVYSNANPKFHENLFSIYVYQKIKYVF